MEATHQARQTAIGFLAQEGLLDETRWAIVDVGWSLNCQAALKRVLSMAKGENFEPLGFYIGLTSDHLDVNEAGHARSFIANPGSIFSRRRVIIEHCFTPSTHATTRSYDHSNGSSVPVFGPEIRSDSELEYALRLHEVAKHQAKLLRTDAKFRDAFNANRDAIIRNVVTFISKPSRKDAKLMRNFGTSG